MKKGIITFLMYSIGVINLLGAPKPGHATKAPIDTNEIILIIAAVLLTVGVIAYKKLSLKKSLISF